MGKWLLPAPGSSSEAREAYWEQAHVEHGYEDVYSVSEDARFVRTLVDAVLRSGPVRQVLLAGCGSRTVVQQALLAAAPPDCRLTATDFAPVIEVAERDFAHPRLRYLALGSDDATTAYDCVVAVNVLVSDSDRANRDLVRDWAAQLVNGGRLVLFLPVLFAGLDLALLSGREDLRSCLDLERSTWTERLQGVEQIEYSPLRLRRVLSEAGLVVEELQLVFLEDESSRRQAQRHYGLDDPDLAIYEQLVIARR
jgi:SAM-dependent methyltransferase